MSGFRGVWIAVAVVALLPILAHAARHRSVADFYSGEGFAAFYCAGNAVRERRDPYATEPLGSCERATGAVPGGVAEPAPLPPATLGIFALLASLPFRTASLVWLAVLGVSVAVTGLALVRIAPRVPPPAIWTALLPGLAILNVSYGETPPLVAAGLALGAYAMQRGRTGAAVGCVVVAALFEPHVAGAAWLAIFLAVPRSRVGFVVSTALLALVGAIVVGFGATIEYVTAVLPLHARSELPANDQYSLTTLLFQAGVPAAAALAAGSVSYVAALAVGCFGAPRIARRMTAPELLVLFPAAVVLLGGTFLHDLQLSLAVPLAVVVANACDRPARPLACLALVVGAVPEPQSALPFLSFGAAAAFAAAWSVPGASGEPARITRTVAGAFGTVAYVAFAIAIHLLGSAVLAFRGAEDFRSAAASPAPSGLAEAGWTAYVRLVSHPATVGEWLAKFAVWALLVTIFVLAARTRRAGPVSGANSAELGFAPA